MRSNEDYGGGCAKGVRGSTNPRSTINSTSNASDGEASDDEDSGTSGSTAKKPKSCSGDGGSLFKKRKLMDARSYRALFKPLRKKARIRGSACSGVDWTCRNAYHSPDAAGGISTENNLIGVFEIRNGCSYQLGKFEENCSGDDGEGAGKGSVSSSEAHPEGTLDDGKGSRVIHSCKDQKSCADFASMSNCEQGELLPECGDGLPWSSQSFTIVKDSGDPTVINENIDNPEHTECSTKESPFVPVTDLKDGSVFESPRRTVVSEGFCSNIHATRVNDMSCVQGTSNIEAVPTSSSGTRSVGDIARVGSNSINSESELVEDEIRESHTKNICHKQKIVGSSKVLCALEISPVKLHQESLKDGLLLEQIVLIKKTCDKRMKELLQKQGIELEGFKTFKETEKMKIKNKNDQDRYDQHFKSQRRKLVVMQISARTEERKRKEKWLRDAYAGKLSESFDAVPLPGSEFIAEEFRESHSLVKTSDYRVSSSPSVCFSGKQSWKGETSIKDSECSSKLGYRYTRIQTKRTDHPSNKTGVIDCRYGKNYIGLRNKAIDDRGKHSRASSSGAHIVSSLPSQMDMPSVVAHSSNGCETSAFTHQVPSTLCESTSCINNYEQGMNLSPKVVAPMQHFLGTVTGIVMDSVKSAHVEIIDHDMLLVSGEACPGQKLSFAEPIIDPELSPTDKSPTVGCETLSKLDGFISGQSSLSSQNMTSTLEHDENAGSVEYVRPAVSDAVNRSSTLSSSQATIVPFAQSDHIMHPDKIEDHGISDHVESRRSYNSSQLVMKSLRTADLEPSTEHEEHAASDEVGDGQMLIPSSSTPIRMVSVSHSAEALPHVETEALLSDVVNSGQCPNSSPPIMIPNLQLTDDMPSAEHERPVMPDEAPSGSWSHSSMPVKTRVPPSTDTSNSTGLAELFVSEGKSSKQVSNFLPPIIVPMHPTNWRPAVDHEIPTVLGIGSGELRSSSQHTSQHATSMIQPTNNMLPAIEKGSIVHGARSSKVGKSAQSIADYMHQSANVVSSMGLTVQSDNYLHSVDREEPVVLEREAGCTINSQTSESLSSGNNNVALNPVQSFSPSCQDVLFDEHGRSSEPAVTKTMQAPDFPGPTSVPAESTEVANLQVQPFSNSELLGCYHVQSSSSTLLHSVEHGQTNLSSNMINEEILHTEANLPEPSVRDQFGVTNTQTAISGLPSPETVISQLGTQRNAHVVRTTNVNRHANLVRELSTSMAQPFFISAGLRVDPLENELLRIRREEALANQMYKNMKMRLQSDLESELDKVQKKYEMLIQGAEEAFSQKKTVLDMIYNKICRNQLLAKEFSSKFADKEVAGIAVLPGVPSNISQLFVQRATTASGVINATTSLHSTTFAPISNPGTTNLHLGFL